MAVTKDLIVSAADENLTLTADRAWALGNATVCDAVIAASGSTGTWLHLRYVSGWTLRPADGVDISLNSDPLPTGRSTRLNEGRHELAVRRTDGVVTLALSWTANSPPASSPRPQTLNSRDPDPGPGPPRNKPAGHHPAGSNMSSARAATSSVRYPVPADKRLSIGRRGGTADILLDGDDIALHHADVFWTRGQLTVRDRSRGGGLSFQGANQLVARIPPGGSFLLGHKEIDVHNDSISIRPVRRPLTLSARALTAQYSHAKQPTLRGVDLSMAGGVHAVMGPSGGGKSTLCFAILGEVAVDEQTEITLHGISLTDPGRGAVDHLISFVPQQDSIPMDLRVRQALMFVGELRLAHDLPRSALASRVEDVLTTLKLTHVGERMIAQLSGGQRKRVSVAAELLSDPLLLLLDEPTSGLDEGLDRGMMKLLQQLSSTGMSVIIVTHSTANLDLADEVVALTSAGQVAYSGPARELRPAYGGADYAQLMDRLREGERKPAPFVPDIHPNPSAKQGHSPAQVRSSTGVLMRREYRRMANQRRLASQRSAGGAMRAVRSWLADRRVLYLLVAPLVTAGLAVIAGRGGLTLTGTTPGDVSIVLVVLVFTSVFFATAMSAAGVVGDADLIRRETRWGVSARSQITSRSLLAAEFALVQAAVSSAVFLTLREGPPTAYGIPGWVVLFVTLALLNIAGSCLGIAVSTFSATVEKAVFGLMWVSVAQVVMTGLLIRFGEISGLVDRGLSVLSTFLPTRWAVGALGADLDLNSIPGEVDRLWTADLTHVLTAWSAIAVLAICYYVAAVLALHRRRKKLM
jgi:ABC-type multidrug transport system ATPase subunit